MEGEAFQLCKQTHLHQQIIRPFNTISLEKTPASLHIPLRALVPISDKFKIATSNQAANLLEYE